MQPYGCMCVTCWIGLIFCWWEKTSEKIVFMDLLRRVLFPSGEIWDLKTLVTRGCPGVHRGNVPL